MAKKECNICKAQVVALHRHMKQMHMQNAHTTDCNHCGKQFSSNRVKEHIRSVHGPATFDCDFRDKMFTTNFKLTSHKKYIHTERNLDYECDACGKQSNNQNAHNVHRSTHNIDRPFKCNLCDSAFKQKNFFSVMKELTQVKKFPVKNATSCLQDMQFFENIKL